VAYTWQRVLTSPLPDGTTEEVWAGTDPTGALDPIRIRRTVPGGTETITPPTVATPSTVPEPAAAYVPGGFSGSGGSTVNPVSGWVNPNSIGYLQSQLGADDPAVRAAAATALAEKQTAWERAKLATAAGEAYQQYLAAQRKARFAPGDPATSTAVSAALQAWYDAQAVVRQFDAEPAAAPLNMADWAKGYAAQQSRYAAAGGEDAYMASQNKTASAPKAITPGLLYGALASAPHRTVLSAPTSPAAADTVGEIMAEMATKEASGAATMQVNALPGYRPIKMRPRSR
jgi:hypothetical protein